MWIFVQLCALNLVVLAHLNRCGRLTLPTGRKCVGLSVRLFVASVQYVHGCSCVSFPGTLVFVRVLLLRYPCLSSGPLAFVPYP